MKLGSGSKVFIADNVYDESIGGILVQKENDENTYKNRTLEDGSQYEVLKNYFNKKELQEIFKSYSRGLDIHIGKCFWWVSYRIK